MFKGKKRMNKAGVAMINYHGNSTKKPKIYIGNENLQRQVILSVNLNIYLSDFHISLIFLSPIYLSAMKMPDHPV